MIEFERAPQDDYSQGALQPREFLQPKMEVIVSLDQLHKDNQLADRGLNQWDRSRIEGKHIVIEACGDSREEIPLNTRSEIVQAIATGGPKEPYMNLLRGRNNSASVTQTHHDGETVTDGVMPVGCGGSGLKASLEHANENLKGTAKFAHEDVDHKDPIVQSCRSAFKKFLISGKPALAATQDHITGEIHPVFALWNTRNTQHQIFHKDLTLEDLMLPEKYNPEKIYAEGLPCVDLEDLPDVFQEYLTANKTQMLKLSRDFPNYQKRQKTQNPSTLFLTTDIRDPRLKYPTTFEAPGSFFRLTLPRRKYNIGESEDSIEVTQADLGRIFAQAEYPVTHFDKAKNIVIETPSFNLSTSIANKLLAEDFMSQWKNQNDIQLIVIESRGGKIIQMGDFPQLSNL